jgi:hypothetical protein
MGGLLRKLARTLTSPSSIFNAIFRLFRIRTRRACGVILTHIGSAVEQTPDLFGVMARDARQERLFEILDAIKRWRLFHL